METAPLKADIGKGNLGGQEPQRWLPQARLVMSASETGRNIRQQKVVETVVMWKV